MKGYIDNNINFIKYIKRIKNTIFTLIALLLIVSKVNIVFADNIDYSIIFDPTYYSVTYPELGIIYNYDQAMLYNHFISYGIKEGKSPSAEFILEFYKYNNKDLEKEYKDNNESYYMHYVLKGRAEGRVANRVLPEKNRVELSSNIFVDEKSVPKSVRNKISNDYLILINENNSIPVSYKPPLKRVYGGQQMHSNIADLVDQIIKDAKADGINLSVLSGYRSAERQELLFNKRMIVAILNGTDPILAYNEAKNTNPLPGTSEHQSGLCMDIAEEPYTSLVSSLENTKGYKWLLKHCMEYGFILRYPKNKGSITKIIYEPWHFRYVGIEAATQIMKNGLTLEEYIDKENKKKILATNSEIINN